MITNIVILSHEHEAVFVAELVQHLKSSPLKNSIMVFSTADILASDGTDILDAELQKANIAMVVLSSQYLSDDILSELRNIAIEMHEADKLETLQILARSVYVEIIKTKKPLKMIPLEGTLASQTNRDVIYVQVIDFVLDKIELIKLKIEVMRLMKELGK